MASVSAAIGRPDTVTSAGALIACVSGHNDLMFGLSAIAGPSSYTKTPAKLVEYAQAPAAASASGTSSETDACDEVSCGRLYSPTRRLAHYQLIRVTN